MWECQTYKYTVKTHQLCHYHLMDGCGRPGARGRRIVAESTGMANYPSGQAHTGCRKSKGD